MKNGGEATITRQKSLSLLNKEIARIWLNGFYLGYCLSDSPPLSFFLILSLSPNLFLYLSVSLFLSLFFTHYLSSFISFPHSLVLFFSFVCPSLAYFYLSQSFSYSLSIYLGIFFTELSKICRFLVWCFDSKKTAWAKIKKNTLPSILHMKCEKTWQKRWGKKIMWHFHSSSLSVSVWVCMCVCVHGWACECKHMCVSVSVCVCMRMRR